MNDLQRRIQEKVIVIMMNSAAQYGQKQSAKMVNVYAPTPWMESLMFKHILVMGLFVS